MLRVLHLENWKSFHEPVDFSMIAGRGTRHNETLALNGKRDARILPIAAIYGANAAGKSALLDAVHLLQQLVSEPRARGRRLPYNPHKLYGVGEPTVLGVEIVLDVPDPTASREAVVYYEVAYTAERVISESLYRLRSADEEALFLRDEGGVELFGDLDNDDFVQAIARTVQGNSLLLEALANSEDRVDGIIAGVIRWFKRLALIRRGARFVTIPQHISKDDDFRQVMAAGLAIADTGICDVLFAQVEREKVPLPDEMLDDFETKLVNAGDEGFLTASSRQGAFFHVKREGSGEVSYERLVARHEGTEQQFDLPFDHESDGTIQYLNLLPILYLVGREDHRGVFLVDELEDSLHPKLTEEFLRRFLSATGEKHRRQLIFTTHELHLLRSELLRKDEIWLVEKRDHNSDLIRLTDFSDRGVRDGADLRKIYMSGRLGGVPRI